MAGGFKFNTSKLERQIKDGLTSVFIDKNKEAMINNVDKLMVKMHKTMTTPRHKARSKEKVGAFSQYGVPVDTGRLQSSIKKLNTTFNNGHIIGIITQDASIAPYGASVEFGHGIRPAGSPYKGKKRGGYIGWVPPQSFMRSTRDLYQPQIKKLIQQG
jgi:hypothetical protein